MYLKADNIHALPNISPLMPCNNFNKLLQNHEQVFFGQAFNEYDQIKK